MSSEIVIAIFSSLTTVCVVLVKSYLTKKRDNRLSQDMIDIIKLHNVKSIKINIQEHNGDFNFKSEASSPIETFIPLGDIGVQIVSSEELLPENQKLIIKYMENQIQKRQRYV